MSVDVPRLLDALGIGYRTHGPELWAPCPHPEHKETRASWSIYWQAASPGNGGHHCFGCGFGGDALDLAAACLGGTSRAHARQWVTDHGLWLVGAVPLAVELVVRPSARQRLTLPLGLLGGPLGQWVTPVRRYMQGRGITATQVMRWRILYATDGSMAGRIVFPLRDERGEWLSFHARSYADQEKRYKNASAADGFDPGAVFGLEHWPAVAARKAETVVLTEGTIDALACERAGANHICAVGGSQLHARQLLKLARWGRIVCATDGDAAGEKLANAVRGQLARTCTVVRAPIAKGEDAASMPVEALKEALLGAQ